MDVDTQKKIDTIIYETTGKMEAIVAELQNINFSDLDDVAKREKTDYLRREFESTLNEQQKRVEEVMKQQRS